jgi:hypothetical protein
MGHYKSRCPNPLVPEDDGFGGGGVDNGDNGGAGGADGNDGWGTGDANGDGGDGNTGDATASW